MLGLPLFFYCFMARFMVHSNLSARLEFMLKKNPHVRQVSSILNICSSNTFNLTCMFILKVQLMNVICSQYCSLCLLTSHCKHSSSTQHPPQKPMKTTTAFKICIPFSNNHLNYIKYIINCIFDFL